MGEGLIVRRGGSGGKPEGLNVWRKYDGYIPSGSGTISFIPLSPIDTTARVQVAVSGEINLSDITVNDFVGKTLLTKLDSKHTKVTFNSTSLLYLFDEYGGYSTDFSYTYNPSTGIINIPTSQYFAKLFADNTTYQSFTKTIQETKGTISGFVVDDDASAYPDGGTQGGYYYELLAQVASANVMSLSDDALETVQADYREQIVSEVSQS